MKKIHYIMPMAGSGSRFYKKGFCQPKPLIPIYGKPFFYWAVQSIRKFVEITSLDFVVLYEHVDKFGIDKEILKYFPEARLHVLEKVTAGAVLTCMEGVVKIEDNNPVLFNDCDHLFKCTQFNKFCEKDGNQEEAEGILLTFTAKEEKYSFIERGTDGTIIRTVEKQAVSDEAICGCYYFKNKKIFLDSAEGYLKTCHYTEYFMSGVYNELLAHQFKVESMKTDFHVSFGTPEEYEMAKKTVFYEELA